VYGTCHFAGNWLKFLHKILRICLSLVSLSLAVTFYRTMHFSAKHGLAIACRLSVRLFVALVDCDQVGWTSLKIFSRLVSVGNSLSAHPNIMDLLQGEQPEI